MWSFNVVGTTTVVSRRFLLVNVEGNLHSVFMSIHEAFAVFMSYRGGLSLSPSLARTIVCRRFSLVNVETSLRLSPVVFETSVWLPHVAVLPVVCSYI